MAQPFRGRECSPGHRRSGTCSTCHWFDSHEVTGIAGDGGECFHPTSPPVRLRGGRDDRRKPYFYGAAQAPWAFLGRRQTCALWQERVEPGVSVEAAKRAWEKTFGAPYPG